MPLRSIREADEGWKFPGPTLNTETNKKSSSVWLDFPDLGCWKWSLRSPQRARTGRDQGCCSSPGAGISLVAAERGSLSFSSCVQSPVDDGQISPIFFASHEQERVLFLEQLIFCFGCFVHEWYDQRRRGRCAQRLLDLWSVD